jgi:pimeloyl-ACP methyl ester carboxylesterase
MDETALPLTTAAGRTLTAAAYGPHDGTPVVSLHGTPGSRLFPPPDRDLLDRVGIRLITFDRPGYGGSDRRPERRVADIRGGLDTVATAFGLQHFAVIGYSGGGPHALAAAALMPELITRCAAVSSPAPFDAGGLDFMAGMSDGNVEEFGAALRGADALAEVLDPVAAAATDDIYAFLAALRADLPDVDAEVLDRPDITELFASSTQEALRPGAQGWLDDDLAFVHPWGCDLAQIEVPVAVWHGTEDRLVPLSHAHWLLSRIPEAEGQIVAGTGHFGMLDHLERIYRWLVG